ncbi:MAG: hypothetical protein IT271_02695 [Chitinophagales bacterium]|nr:hypothetical protein [Chitinophagales bacterium]
MSDGIRITLCILVCICLITPIFLSLFYFDTHELLNGELKGNLVIGKDFISFDGVKTEIQLIKNVHFNIYDYYEKIINSRSLQFYFPTLSQGVDNSIRFTTTNGKFYTVFFRLNSKYHRNDLNPFITELIKHRIILLNEGIELMQLKTKEEIEELRNIILQ